ncbi:hypothetical protein [Streptomyces sp. NPDC002845]
MTKSPTPRATVPDTVWPARGRYLGSAAEDSVRHRLLELTSSGVVDDHVECESPGDGAEGCAFEARWRVADDVVVRARLNIGAPQGKDHDVRDWVLVAEADRAWDPQWPSPATMFWPDEPDADWDHDVVPGLRLRETNPLPTDDRQLRRLLKECARRSWSIHVVVHEAMTPDERGRRTLVPQMPPSLRHRVVEHRAVPDQFHAVNWALGDLGVQVPRGGAVVLPGASGHPGDGEGDFAVRSVFLDGSRPTDLIDTVVRYAQLPRPLPEGAEDAIAEHRREWRLLTVEEELAHARRLVSQYAEALEAMTRSRDLYRDAAERAHEALAAYREYSGTVPPPREEPRKRERFSFRTLTRPLERVSAHAKLLRTSDGDDSAPDTSDTPDAADASNRSDGSERDESDASTSVERPEGSTGP